jgi:CMP-N,N'-diacetyllegionaminic acid synthase
MKAPQITAIITARGGSKRLPDKCLLPLAGRPLIEHTIFAAHGCPRICRTVVTTEDPRIAAISRNAGVPVIDRPPELSRDDTTSNDVVRHTLDVLEEDGLGTPYFVLLQPTSPLRTSRHLSESIDAFFAAQSSCCISVCEMPHSLYKSYTVKGGQLLPLFGAQYLSTPSQTLTPVYQPNGAIFLMATETFLAHGSFFVEPALPYFMELEESIDIDTAAEFRYAEFLMEQRCGTDETEL